ncbi:MAG: cell division protein ZapA [Hyphomicrobiales bacterium]
MGQVSVTLNGRNYRLECSEGEETHLIELAEYLGTHVDTMRRKFGQVGDDRLILMASLVMADELWEVRRQIQELKSSLAEAHRDKTVAQETAKAAQSELAAKISGAAERLERMNAHFSGAANRR